MLTYTYLVRDPTTGNKIKGEVEADTQKNAVKILLDKGLAPLSVKLKDEYTGLRAFRHRVPTKDKVVFSRQLSTLINAGLPLVQSLNAVQKQTSNGTLRAVIGKVVRDVEAGSTLADALGRYPKLFDDVYTSLVAAGEASGTLDVSLERLATQQEKDAEIVSKVRGALIYPAIVMMVLVFVVIFMLVAVLPQVQSLYNQLPGARLPFVTIVLLDVSNFILNFWWVVLALLGIAGFFFSKWAKSREGILVIDEFKMKAWPIGPLFMKLYMARFARTASTLVGSGVPMIKMLNTTAQAVGNIHLENSVIKATEKVKGGKSLSESLRGDPHFLELVPNMVNIGEQSGALDNMLAKVADYYEKEVDNQVRSISTIIEPALMIVVGIIALIIVAAVLLPIYSLAGKNFIHT